MWRISCNGFTFEEVLIMAYMNVLEAKSCTQVSGGRPISGSELSRNERSKGMPLAR